MSLCNLSCNWRCPTIATMLPPIKSSCCSIQGALSQWHSQKTSSVCLLHLAIRQWGAGMPKRQMRPEIEQSTWVTAIGWMTSLSLATGWSHAHQIAVWAYGMPMQKVSANSLLLRWDPQLAQHPLEEESFVEFHACIQIECSPKLVKSWVCRDKVRGLSALIIIRIFMSSFRVACRNQTMSS